MSKPLAIALPVAFAVLASLSEAPRAADQPPAIPPCPSDAAKPDVVALIKRIDRLLTGRSSVVVMTMSITTPSWRGTLKLKVWAEGKDYALIRVLDSGPRETGMMTLKREKQLWNYLPQAGRVMKLPSGMLGDAWMGSDFTNDDLVRGTSIVSDFDTKVTGTLTHDGRKAWRLVLVPRPRAVVVWGKVEMIVDRASCVPLLERFYDEDGKLARTMSLGDIRAIGWRRFPARMAVKPQDARRETVVTWEEIRFDIDVPDDTFSLHRLQRGR